eukprot:gene25172-30400_t
MNEYIDKLSRLEHLISSSSGASGAKQHGQFAIIDDVLRDMRTNHALDTRFYHLWLKYIAAVRNHDLNCLKEWFSSVHTDAPHFQLIYQSVNEYFDLFEDDKVTEGDMREVFEVSIRTCGVDIMTGAEIWSKNIDFEIDLLEDILENSAEDEKAVTAAKARLFKCFHRCLSLPLVGHEKILKRCETCCEDFITSEEEGLKIVNPALIERIVQSAEQALAKRIGYEKQLYELSESENARDITSAYLRYIDFEIEDREISRAQRLFERLLLLPQATAFAFVRYLHFLLFVVKQRGRVYAVLRRALFVLGAATPYVIHKLYLLHVESTTAVDTTANAVDNGHVPASFAEIQAHYRKIIGGGQAADNVVMYVLGEAEDYVDLFCSVLGYIQRQLRIHSADTTYSSALLAFQARVLQDWENVLLTYYTQWKEGWTFYARVAASLTAINHTDNRNLEHVPTTSLPAIYTHLSRVLLRQWYILEEAIWHQTLLHNQHSALTAVRDVFKKAISGGKRLGFEDMDRKGVARRWVRWEDMYGVFASTGEVGEALLQGVWEALRLGWEDLVGKEIEDSQGGSMDGAAVQDTYTPQPQVGDHNMVAGNTSNQRKKRERYEEDRETATKPTKKAKPTELSTKPSGDSKIHEQQQGKKKDKDKGSCGAAGSVVFPVEVHVSNFPFTASLADIQTFLACTVLSTLPMPTHRPADTNADTASAPQAASMHLVMSKAGASRGILAVTVHDAALHKALHRLEGMGYEGRGLAVEDHAVAAPAAGTAHKGDPTGSAVPAPSTSSTSSGAPLSLFLEGIHMSVQEAELTQDIETKVGVGSVRAVKVNKDKQTGLSKGSALVQFKTMKARDRLLQLAHANASSSGAGATTGGFIVVGSHAENKVSVRRSRFGLVAINPDEHDQTETDKSNKEGRISEIQPAEAHGSNSVSMSREEAVGEHKEDTQEKKADDSKKSSLFKPRGVSMKNRLKL